ncbi:hypothetical protein H490_0110925 [Leucobacter sp. UCD-THU]|jgi:hypothetical protein|uniref:Histidine kinase n=1 Tax=Leucobacter muris TaxID=1935379 RepID=A0ABX5QEM2_9MICO|nr:MULTISPECIES: hypothetical protein [Leucobacter]EYT53227.1 hypothetical protein H490_0110925 [Leucobacter sp. UCD-THU]QAB17526.1 hypothetical protein Leucomu_05955 [Leucobacter muris]
MPSSPADHPRSRVAWRALAALLAVESALLLWVLGVTVVGALGSEGNPLQNLSLIVMAALSFAWVVVTLVGAVKARASWVRGSSLTIHVLLFAAGTGCLQIGIGPWWLGFALVALALAGFAAAILARPAVQSAGEQ